MFLCLLIATGVVVLCSAESDSLQWLPETDPLIDLYSFTELEGEWEAFKINYGRLNFMPRCKRLFQIILFNDLIALKTQEHTYQLMCCIWRYDRLYRRQCVYIIELNRYGLYRYIIDFLVLCLTITLITNNYKSKKMLLDSHALNSYVLQQTQSRFILFSLPPLCLNSKHYPPW